MSNSKREGKRVNIKEVEAEELLIIIDMQYHVHF